MLSVHQVFQSIFNRHEKPMASRKFIDLIYEASSAFPNWDPSRKVEPGDFGEVDRKTGQFAREGNIFTHEVTKAIAEPYPPVFGDVKECKRIISLNANKRDFNFGPQANIPGIVDAHAKVKVEFTAKRGAAFIINRPRTSYLDHELIGKIETDEKCVTLLKRKLLIVDVFASSSYAMYLSSGQSETVEIALVAEAPALDDPVVSPGLGSPGGQAVAQWWCSVQQGTFEHAHQTSNCFYPLYIHKQLKWKGRRETPDPDGIDPGYGFMHSDLPWVPLTEDGDEVQCQPDSDEVTSDEDDDVEL